MVDLEVSLHKLGLTVQEARVYLALVKLGKATVKEVRVLTGLPRARLYDVLDHLEREGWISKENTRPKTYFPEEPKKVGAALKGRVEDAWRRVVSDLTSLYEKSSYLHRGVVKTLRGEENLWLSFEQMVSTAHAGVLIVLGFVPERLTERISQILADAATKAKVRLLLARTLSERVLVPGGDIFVSEIPPVAVVVVDGEQVMLGSAGQEEQLAVWTDDKALVEFCRATLQALLSETGQPVPLRQG